MKQIHPYIGLDRVTMRFIRVGIAVAIFVMLVCGASVVFFAVSQWQISDRRARVEIEYTETLRAQVGKPQVIEQHYISPTK